jgi:hypothetical protein
LFSVSNVAQILRFGMRKTTAVGAKTHPELLYRT